MPIIEPSNHPNQNGSKFLGLITFLAIPIAYVLHVIFGKGVEFHLVVFIIASVLCLVSSTINFLNTFETNKSWKAYLAVAAIIAVLLSTVIPIATHNAQ